MPDLSGTANYFEAVAWIVIGLSVAYGVVSEWLREKFDRSR